MTKLIFRLLKFVFKKPAWNTWFSDNVVLNSIKKVVDKTNVNLEKLFIHVLLSQQSFFVQSYLQYEFWWVVQHTLLIFVGSTTLYAVQVQYPVTDPTLFPLFWSSTALWQSKYNSLLDSLFFVGDTALYAAMIPFAARFTLFLGSTEFYAEPVHVQCPLFSTTFSYLWVSLQCFGFVPDQIPKVRFFQSWMFYLEGCRYLLPKKWNQRRYNFLGLQKLGSWSGFTKNPSSGPWSRFHYSIRPKSLFKIHSSQSRHHIQQQRNGFNLNFQIVLDFWY